jgi:hypothetical protein
MEGKYVVRLTGWRTGSLARSSPGAGEAATVPKADVRGRRIRSTLGVATALLVAAGLLAVGARLPATAQDSSGSITAAEYDLGDTAFTDPQTGTVSELRAVVHYPRTLTG